MYDIRIINQVYSRCVRQNYCRFKVSVRDASFFLHHVRRVTFFSSMCAALKLDHTRIKIAEFWKVTGDPLARALRNRFKRDKTFPKRKFQCVYSDELLENKLPIDPDEKGNSSIIHITAVFGFMLAGLVVQDAVKKAV